MEVSPKAGEDRGAWEPGADGEESKAGGAPSDHLQLQTLQTLYEAPRALYPVAGVKPLATRSHPPQHGAVTAPQISKGICAGVSHQPSPSSLNPLTLNPSPSSLNPLTLNPSLSSSPTAARMSETTPPGAGHIAPSVASLGLPSGPSTGARAPATGALLHKAEPAARMPAAHAPYLNKMRTTVARESSSGGGGGSGGGGRGTLELSAREMAGSAASDSKGAPFPASHGSISSVSSSRDHEHVSETAPPGAKKLGGGLLGGARGAGPQLPSNGASSQPQAAATATYTHSSGAVRHVADANP